MHSRTLSSATRAALLTLALTALTVAPVLAQQVTLPPGGGNQRSVVTQYIGLVSVTVDYNSPDVTGPNGQSREGAIWGQLVPYGMSPPINFGNGKPFPWRVGANENTTFTVSHDVLVQDQPLAAGTYGLHMIPGEEEWTVIFSNNSSSWGSYFYEESEDALRVTTKAQENEFTEWLNFEFIDRQPDHATVALQWERLEVPFTIKVPNLSDLYVQSLNDELRGRGGFGWQGFANAANWTAGIGEHLEQGLEWAETAINSPSVGQRNFQTLSAKAAVLNAMERSEEAMAIMDEAIHDPAANVGQIYTYGRQLITLGLNEKSLEVALYNAERNPDTWPVDWGLTRAYSALGQFDKALEHAKISLERAPVQGTKNFITAQIVRLENGEDINN